MIIKIDMIDMLDEILGFDSTKIEQLNRKMLYWHPSQKKVIRNNSNKRNESLTGAIGNCEDIAVVDGSLLIDDMNYRYVKINGRRKRVEVPSNWVINWSGNPTFGNFEMTSTFVFGIYEDIFYENIESIKQQSDFKALCTEYGVEEGDNDEVIATKLATQYRIWWADIPQWDETEVDFSVVHGPEKEGYRVKMQLLVNGQPYQFHQPRLEITPMNNEFSLRKFGFYGNEKDILLQTDYRLRGNKFSHIRDPRNMRIFAKCSYDEPLTGERRYITTVVENVPVQNYLSPFNYKGEFIG